MEFDLLASSSSGVITADSRFFTQHFNNSILWLLLLLFFHSLLSLFLSAVSLCRSTYQSLLSVFNFTLLFPRSQPIPPHPPFFYFYQSLELSGPPAPLGGYVAAAISLV